MNDHIDFSAVLTFPVIFCALYAAHQVGDHWVQTHAQACDKGQRTAAGRAACLMHVATLTATKLAALLALAFVTGLPLGSWQMCAGLAVDAVSHYWADRRWTLRDLAERVGKGDFYRYGLTEAAPCGTGAYALDQSWHVGWLFIAALIISKGF
ncbi:DUF3307 domain-containing protein [Nonomuraea bangladeshensis]|uniref:DUF3307 domain-containing protein n=1 Tax=Nonomuraea bangladeshensis TaxID=404385 RepID=UPI003C2D7F9F